MPPASHKSVIAHVIRITSGIYITTYHTQRLILINTITIPTSTVFNGAHRSIETSGFNQGMSPPPPDKGLEPLTTGCI